MHSAGGDRLLTSPPILKASYVVITSKGPSPCGHRHSMVQLLSITLTQPFLVPLKDDVFVL